MQVDQISNLDALIFILGLLTFAWLFLRLVPAPEPETKQRTSYGRAEITAYDGELPKYFLVAALALIVGGAHTVVKNLPGFWQWLWEAGYGGHLFRDLSNSHIIIVGGGTVLLTAFTWYVLPRFVNRPLYSTFLAGASFWLTVIGVFGFYVAWLTLGLVEGNMVRHGWEYLAAKEALGKWHRIPTALTSTIMGFGYWSYVLNVFLTVVAAKSVRRKPLNYLTKFSLVSAGALFVGTVQGVIQVLPDNADWIRSAGKFGEYVDPISHAHINLVTGMVVSLAAFLVYFAPRLQPEGNGNLKTVSRRTANRLFWILVPGSLAFYLAFLLLGLVLGGAANGYGGIEAAAWAPVLGRWRGRLLAIAGTAMLAGFWFYFYILWRTLNLRSIRRSVRAATPAGFWLASSVALFVGTVQGLLQLMPGTAAILTTPEEVPNIHAQLNMIGGVMLALIGLVYLLLPELVGSEADARLRRLSLVGIGSGIAGYYVTTLSTGLIRLGYMRQGMSDVEAAGRLGWAAPLILLLTALPMFAGYLAFGTALWRVTGTYRAQWWRQLRELPQHYNGAPRGWQERVPLHYFLLLEAGGAFAGFPGLGWLLYGYALPGIPLLLSGPAVAWAVLPVLMSPYGNGPLAPYGLNALIAYLALTALLSGFSLWLVGRQQPEVGSA